MGLFVVNRTYTFVRGQVLHVYIPLHNVFHNYLNALIILGNIVILITVTDSISSIV